VSCFDSSSGRFALRALRRAIGPTGEVADLEKHCTRLPRNSKAAPMTTAAVTDPAPSEPDLTESMSVVSDALLAEVPAP
jgi:hypothetical protein